ncbi:MAG: hypothetical protein ABIY52_15650 [Gemmatimonadaceae bacterium]
MDQTRTASQGIDGSFGAAAEGSMPVPRPDAAGEIEGIRTTPGRSWTGTALRILRNAAIAVVLMTAIPVGLVARYGDRVWRLEYGNSTRSKIAIAERSRSLLVPRDASITPMQAGLALNSLQEFKDGSAFRRVAVAEHPARSWDAESLSAGMFGRSGPELWRGPNIMRVMEQAEKGYTPAEAAYLQRLAASPVWKQFDMLARAPAVDIIGGQFVVPFHPGANWSAIPLPKYSNTKVLAYASVSRAAYFMQQGQRDSAETALRSVVSFGFMMIDNSTNAMEELIGAVIVGIGRDALLRYYTIVHDARAASPAVAAVTPDQLASIAATTRRDRVTPAEQRGEMIARVSDPRLARGERYETLHQLSVSSCTNVRELIFGPRQDVLDAVAKARATLARYPSERALVDLTSTVPTLRLEDVQYSPISALVASASSIAAVALNNPKLPTCAVIADQSAPQWSRP